MPFESLDVVSYSSSIVTVVISVGVCEIFSVKEWCDRENRVKIRSKSLKWDYLIDRIRVSISVP